MAKSVRVTFPESGAGINPQMPPPALDALFRQQGQTHSALPGRTLFSAGMIANDVLLLVEGTIDIVLHAPDGREIHVRTLQPGSVFGDLAAVDGRARSASALCRTKVRYISLDRHVFLKLVTQNAENAMWFTRRLTTEVRRMTGKYFELSALTARERLYCELLRLAHTAGAPFVKPAPTHAQLAARIGSHREGVSRDMKGLEREGIIRSHRQMIEFLKLEALEQAVSDLRAVEGV